MDVANGRLFHSIHIYFIIQLKPPEALQGTNQRHYVRDLQLWSSNDKKGISRDREKRKRLQMHEHVRLQ
jgi:hypothetical protein